MQQYLSKTGLLITSMSWPEFQQKKYEHYIKQYGVDCKPHKQQSSNKRPALRIKNVKATGGFKLL
jgi:hypothetical protein